MGRTIDRTLDKFQDRAARAMRPSVRTREMEDLRKILATPHGRRFLYRVMERAHCFGSIFNPDPIELAHNAGWHDAGTFVSSECQEADAALFFLLLKDAASDKQRAAIELIEAADGLRKTAADQGDDTDD